MKKFRKKTKALISIVSTVLALLLLAAYYLLPGPEPAPGITLDQVPEYAGEAFVILENNIPRFHEVPATDEPEYGQLDKLNRCTYTVATLSRELMPTEERGNISQVKPTGWVNAEYDFVDGKYLYNRCHLIGFQLTGENANERNLITGTRYMNVEGMLPFENMVADYIKETGNTVAYRVIPVFEGDNLVASGVTMEALSLEDKGEGICFYVFVYNVQPGVQIDYATGESRLADPVSGADEETVTYVVNTSSGKFHLESCSQASSIKAENRETFDTTRSQMILWSFEPAGCCDP